MRRSCVVLKLISWREEKSIDKAQAEPFQLVAHGCVETLGVYGDSESADERRIYAVFIFHCTMADVSRDNSLKAFFLGVAEGSGAYDSDTVYGMLGTIQTDVCESDSTGDVETLVAPEKAHKIDVCGVGTVGIGEALSLPATKGLARVGASAG